MTTVNPDPDVDQATEQLLQRVLDLSAEIGPEVQAAAERAAAHPMPEDDARRLYRRVLSVMRNENRAEHDPVERERIARQIDIELDTIFVAGEDQTADHEQPSADTGRVQYVGNVKMVERFGLKPRKVTPTPIFNGQEVSMWEGYVDANELHLWQDNARIDLNRREFLERNNRAPDDDELLNLMWNGSEATKKDPFDLRPLAASIARRGVEQPPILDKEGIARDGNRRLAAARLVQADPNASLVEKKRARWIKVWVIDTSATPDLVEAVVVARNFEPEYKKDWPEYVKARLVASEYEAARSAVRGRLTAAHDKKIREELAEQFGIDVSRVRRYVRMVGWAVDFEDYLEEQGNGPAEVRYRSNDIFQWFYEIDAGTGQAKLQHKIDNDEDLRGIVYDLMYGVLDSGVQVRNLHKMVAQEDTLAMLTKAHAEYSKGNADEALGIVQDASAEAQRRTRTSRAVMFDQFVERVVERFGAAATDDWSKIPTSILQNLRRVLVPALAAVEVLTREEIEEETEDAAAAGDGVR